MKKLLAMLLALMLALSCTLSLAETADAAPALPEITVTGKYTVDREVLAAALTAFGVDEKTAGIADAAAALMNELGERLIVADNGLELGLSLKGADLFTVVGELTDTGVTVGSSLIPSHVLTFSGETIANALQSAAGDVTSGLASLDFNALGEALGGHAQTFAERCVSAISYGEAVPGDYVMDGISYNVMVPINVDLEAIINALNDFMSDISADETLQSALRQLEDKGFSLTVGESEPIPTEDLPKLDFEAYMTVDESGNTTGATDVVFNVYPAGSEDAVTTGDVLVEDDHVRVIVQFRDPEDADALPVNALYEQTPVKDGMEHRLEFYVQDMFYGFVCRYAMADDITIDSEVYVLDNEKPLLCENVVIAQGGTRTVVLNDGSKEAIAVEDLLGGEKTEELESKLLMDMLFGGLGGLVSTASQAMPEEVETLMSVFMSADEQPAA